MNANECVCGNFFFFSIQEVSVMYLPERALNMELLEHLKYTGCVIKETLRMNPPVPGGFRVALKTFELNVSRSFGQSCLSK